MFVKDLAAISPQATHDLKFESGNFHDIKSKRYLAIEPNYLEFIPANLLRRMGRAVRMGIGAGLPLIQRNKKVDGIIIGSANGGLEDCIHFLNQIVDYNEGTLTPTNFVQSTPNALAGQLALMSKNTCYNMTHTNGSLAFENSLLDGFLFLENQHEACDVLIGAVEEISEYNYNIDFLAGRYKNEEVRNSKLLSSHSEGTICGEGATMFIVSNTKENALAEIVDVAQVTTNDYNILKTITQEFLKKNELVLEMIDLLILGMNGDVRTDVWYKEFHEVLFQDKPVLTFKNLVGEYRTASAFGMYLGIRVLSGKLKNVEAISEEVTENVKYILIYNHFDGIRHGLTLLKKIADKE
jgi:hypothetical protein